MSQICQLAPLDEHDHLIGRLIAKNPAFRNLLASRLSESTHSTADALAKFAGPAPSKSAKRSTKRRIR